MSGPVQNYQLRYDPIEDRLLLAVDIDSERQWAMAISRRMTKELIAYVAKLLAEQKAATVGRDERMRNTLLGIEHQSAVADATASGDTRADDRARTLVAPPGLVKEIKIVPQPGGNTALTFADGDRFLTLDLTPQRLHVLIASLLQIAGGAGWDFPAIAAWLAAPPATTAETGPRVVH